jgi:hypothetical protein
MSGPLPSSVVAGIAFIGRAGGQVKALGGFRKGRHTVPDAASAAATAFLARLCADELAEQAEALFQRTRAALGYKRAEISLSVASPSAVLTARDFAVEIAYALEESDPARYAVMTTLRDLRDADLARTEGFAATFAGSFAELRFELARGVAVEAVIDAVEALDGDRGLRVSYPSDCRECEITVAGVDALVRCSGVALDVVFPRPGGPAELLDAFAAVRDAFQLSRTLAALIG